MSSELDDFDLEELMGSSGDSGSARPSFMPLADKSKMWGPTCSSIEDLRKSPRRIATDIMRLFVANRTPITLWGPIGARKTRSVEALAREVDENGVPYQVITVQPSTEDPTIIHGMMYTSLDSDSGETVMRRSIPDIAQQIINYHRDTGGLTILFMDEMTTCMPAQQHALLGIMTHGKYGGTDISDMIAIIMAANPEGTVSTVNDLGEQVINRGGHIAWYGDVDLFLEDWTSGFHGAVEPPRDDVQWFITNLIDQDKGSAFREPKRWEVEGLVPYDLIEHTERSTTELSRMIELVNDVFADDPDFIRHHYLVEVTRALQGNDWADNMAVVCSMERSRIEDGTIIRLVKEAGVKPEWDNNTLCSALGDTLYVHDGKRLSLDKINGIIERLVERATAEKCDRDAYLAAWAFASTAPNEGIGMGMHAHLVKVLIRGLSMYQHQEMTREEARPNFIRKDILSAITEAIKRNA